MTQKKRTRGTPASRNVNSEQVLSADPAAITFADVDSFTEEQYNAVVEQIREVAESKDATQEEIGTFVCEKINTDKEFRTWAARQALR